MKRKLIFSVVFFALYATASAQSILENDTLLAHFVNRTIVDRFDSSRLSQPSVETTCIAIQTDLPERLIVKSVGQFPVKVIPKNANLRKRKYRKIIKGTVFNVYFKELGPDTLDVNLAGIHYYIMDRKICGEVECGGDMGYIPSGRFVHNSATGLWDFISRETIYEERCREYEERFRKK